MKDESALKNKNWVEVFEYFTQAPLGSVSEEEFDLGLKSPHHMSLGAIFLRTDFKLNEERFEIAMNERGVGPRLALFQRFDWVPTVEQESRLKSKDNFYGNLEQEKERAFQRWQMLREKEVLKKFSTELPPNLSKKRVL